MPDLLTIGMLLFNVARNLLRRSMLRIGGCVRRVTRKQGSVKLSFFLCRWIWAPKIIYEKWECVRSKLRRRRILLTSWRSVLQIIPWGVFSFILNLGKPRQFHRFIPRNLNSLRSWESIGSHICMRMAASWMKVSVKFTGIILYTGSRSNSHIRLSQLRVKISSGASRAG